MSLETDQIVRVLMAERNKLVAYAWSILGDFNLGEERFTVGLFACSPSAAGPAAAGRTMPRGNGGAAGTYC